MPPTECITTTSSTNEDTSNGVAATLNQSATNDEEEVDSSQNPTQATTNADVGVFVSDEAEIKNKCVGV